jgi:hypothetical protein
MQAKPRNSVVVYAAQAGHKADDGLFTPILAEALSAPGRTLAAVLTRGRGDRQLFAAGTGSWFPATIGYPLT